MIIISNANHNDVSTIANFNSAMAMETENKELNVGMVDLGVQTALNDTKHGFYLIVEYNDSHVGQLMITKEWSDWRNGEFWWIQSVYVHPDFRGQGVYKKLYDKVKSLAKSIGDICGIRLYVEKDNKTAQKTYFKLGMTETNYLMYEEEF